MNKSFILVFTCLVFTASCTHNNGQRVGNAKYFKVKKDIRVLHGDRLDTISDSLGISGAIDLIYPSKTSDVYAVISDITRIPPLHYVDLTKDIYLSKISREGHGAGEFGTVSSIFTKDKKELLVTDVQNLRLTIINLDHRDQLKELYNSNPKVINIEFNGLPLDVFPLKNDTYAAIGPIKTNSNKSFAILSSNGKQNKLAGSIPDFNKNIPANVNQLAWRSYATPKPDRSIFVIGYYNTDLLKLYDYTGRSLQKIKGPDFKKLEYSAENGRLSLDDETIRGYIDLASTQDYFYALYSGENIHEPNSNFGKLVYMFDWKGNFIKAFKLDQFAFRIAIDRENKILYALVDESKKPGIYTYHFN